MATKSTYPPPPPFFLLYTDETKRIHESKSTGVSDSSETKQDAFVNDNRDPDWMWVPPPPLEGTFLKFGEPRSGGFFVHELGPGVPQLFEGDSIDKIAVSSELRNLNIMLLETYKELLNALVSDPAAVDPQVTRLGHVFRNMTHILNLARASQARQSVISVLRKQIKERNDRADHLDSCVQKASDFLKLHNVPTSDGDSSISSSLSSAVPVPAAANLSSAAAMDMDMDADGGGVAPQKPLAKAAKLSPDNEKRIRAQQLVDALDALELRAHG